MKVVLVVVGALVLIVVLVLVIGALLPRQHRAVREIVLKRSPREIYSVARDFESTASWRRNLVRVELLAPVNGLARFREVSKDGTVTYEVVEDAADKKLVTRIVDRDLGYSGSWIYEFLAADQGTRVRITEDGEVSNILFRFMSRFVFGHTTTIDTYLTALGEKFGEIVTPK